MNFICHPVNHLIALPRKNEWRAIGNDPQFLMKPENSTATAPGWYVISAKMKTNKGVVIDPCIYYDCGSGFTEANKLDLFFGSDQDWESGQVILLPTTVVRLRMDPSIQDCEFELSELGISRISRQHAGLKMALAIFKRAFGKREKLKITASIAGCLLKFNLRNLGDWLWGAYNTRRDFAYSKWIQLYENHRGLSQAQINEGISALERKPRISILLPVFNTPEKWLRRCIETVLSQTYANWELCIADDASTGHEIRGVLKEFAGRDNRIKLFFRDANGHISAASNTALSMATGEYVALLDHDDELASNALYEVVMAINQNPEWKVIYSDEDKIDEAGQRFGPYFKPEWNYDLFLSQNCVSHLGVYRTDVIRGVGGFREGFEGSQDYDLVLRIIEKIEPSEIGHIAKVLYHWRAIRGSTALGFQQKSYAQIAACKALSEHFDRMHIKAHVNTIEIGFQKVRYDLPNPVPLVTLIVPTKDRVDLLKMSIGSLLKKTDYPQFEIIIVDNQSQKTETHKYFREIVRDKRVRVLKYDKPFNFSAINNFAAKYAQGSIIGLVNNDIEVIHGDWLTEMVSHAVRHGVGAVGAKLYYPDDTIQHAGVIVGFDGVAGHVYRGHGAKFTGQSGRAFLTQNLSAVTGACLLVRKHVYDEVGGLDESLKVAFNDIDFCLRIREAGYRNVWTPFAELYHHESLSRGYEDTPEKQERFQSEVMFMKNRWAKELDHDPAYNPNLSLVGNAFTLAHPPRAGKTP
jgi:O-antigen biosynthesis protein